MDGKDKRQDDGTTAHAGPAAYAKKGENYFAGARADIVSELPQNAHARILEIGCASGNTGALALSRGRCGWYTGVELDETAAQEARTKLSEVAIADIERMTLPWQEQSFDALIMSEVLEHVADPWMVLKRLRPLLKPGGLLFCSAPNVSNYHVICMLLRGDWRLKDSGVLDRTHLRWFTPKTFGELVESAGFMLDYVEPIDPFDAWDRVRIALTGGRCYLFMKQIKIKGHSPG